MPPADRAAHVIAAEGGPAMVLLATRVELAARYGLTVSHFNKLRETCRGMLRAGPVPVVPPVQPVASVAPVAVQSGYTSPQVSAPSGGNVHLIIGDAHAAPNQNLDRFVWLGRMIRAIRPTHVIAIGDVADMPSISSYDRGKRSGENARYSEDISATNEAWRLVHVNAGDALDGAIKIVTLGNHEHRIERYCNDHPELDGQIGIDDLDFARRGWEVVPFLTPRTVDGVTYCHYFHKPGGTKNGIGGVNAGRAMILHALCTTVAGHSHMLHHASAVNLQGRRIHGLQVGRYDEEHHGYAGQANAHAWWSGICVLRDVRDGDFALEQVPMARIRERWGSAANV